MEFSSPRPNLEDLSLEELWDVVDAAPITFKASSSFEAEIAADPDHYTIFDTREEYMRGISRITKQDPEVWVDHELSHGICALKVGMKSVRYAINNKPYESNGPQGAYRLLTVTEGPATLPNLAVAAIKAAPKNPSRHDLHMMRRLVYDSIDILEERITKWNKQDNGLVIPMPGTIDTSAERL